MTRLPQLPPVPRPGLLSVVLVAAPEARVTLDALSSLEQLDWPSENLETIVVMTPGAGAVDAAALPGRGRIVHASDADGLAGARNAGADAAAGTDLAFLAVDARPDARWLEAAADATRDDARLAAVGSKIVAPDGTVEFAGAACTYAGEPVYPHAGEPAGGVGDRRDSALFASDAAMVVDAQAFRWVGGFDPHLASGVEFADLGWRLWLAGFHVAYEPASVVVGRRSADDRSEESQIRRVLGSLGMIYKNYDDRNLGSALAGAVLAVQGSPVGSAALERFARAMPDLVEARRKVQAARVVADSEITPLFRLPFAIPEGADAQRVVIQDGLNVASVFSQRHRIAIVTPDVLRPQMAGPAIRAWHMALALSREHDVRLATTMTCELSHPDFPVTTVDEAGMRELDAWCDVLIFQGHILDQHPWLRKSPKIVVVDIYDPFHLEVLEQSRDQEAHVRRHVVRTTVEVLNEQLARGDFFLCASEKQRDFWLGQLSGVGRINPAVYDGDANLAKFLTVVPFGVSDEAPEHTRSVLKGVVDGIGLTDKVVLWGGGVYNWFDPLTLIRAVDRLRHRVPEVRLYFMGMRHPNPNVPKMQMAYATKRLAEELGLLDTFVFFNEGWVEYEERQNYLLEADVGVSTHLDQVETAFSFRTRILDYLWTSLPIVATAGDSFAEIIEHNGVGITVPPGDEHALEEALYLLLTDDDHNAHCRAASAACVEAFRWSRVLEPLLDFCRSPRRAPDLVDPRQRAMIGDPMAQAIWGRQGLRYTARVVIGHLRRGEYDDLMRKVRMRARTFLFPDSGGPGARPL